VLLSGATAMAQSVPQATVSDYRIYRSHVDWQGDCVAAPSAASDEPEYRVYRSHVAWRNDAVAAHPASSPTGQKWEIVNSDIGHHDTCAFETMVWYDACSLHLTVMLAPPASYSWNDVKDFVAVITGQRG
jgi:hypothetical protein